MTGRVSVRGFATTPSRLSRQFRVSLYLVSTFAKAFRESRCLQLESCN